MSNCLVTGGAGFIGSHVVDLLIEAGHKVTIIDNLSTGKRENLNPNALFLKGEIDEINDLELKYDYIFHLAALPRVQFSIDDPVTTHHHNLTNTLYVLEYCRKNKCKLIFSSSSSIYDDVIPAREYSAKRPRSPYAMQKWMSEEYIRLYHNLFGLEYCILRYFNVYGERAGADGAYPLVIAQFLKQKAEGKPLTIINGGQQSRDFTYVKDVAKANLMAMDWEGEFNIGNGRSVSVNEIASYIGGETINGGERKGEPFATLADSSKARDKGWKPTIEVRKWCESQ